MIFDVTDGVFGIDAELFGPGFASVYLFDDEEPTLLDTGAAACAETIIDGLFECGCPPDELEHIVCSHVHTDHTGSVSALLEKAPNANVYIHELTAPHLTDPTRLIESSRRAMGEHFDDVGEQGPVSEENVVTVPDDGMTLDIGSNSLEFVHAPGHSPDHCAVWNPERRLLFAAECLGNHFDRVDRWFPPASVPNFDVETTERTIDRLRGLDPDRIILPHFGVVEEPTTAFERSMRALHRFDRRILELYETAGSLDATIEAVADELVDISPPYTTQIEAFQAELATKGYLNYHGVEI
jgi:glyoxylase-like metal-dependent hydrolase (beta-lactamase superfamily II)